MQHPFWGDVSLPADAKRRTGWADLFKRALSRQAVTLGIKAQRMSEAGVLWSIDGMLSFVIGGIVGYGLILIPRLSPRVVSNVAHGTLTLTDGVAWLPTLGRSSSARDSFLTFDTGLDFSLDLGFRSLSSRVEAASKYP